VVWIFRKRKEPEIARLDKPELSTPTGRRRFWQRIRETTGETLKEGKPGDGQPSVKKPLFVASPTEEDGGIVQRIKRVVIGFQDYVRCVKHGFSDFDDTPVKVPPEVIIREYGENGVIFAKREPKGGGTGQEGK